MAAPGCSGGRDWPNGHSWLVDQSCYLKLMCLSGGFRAGVQPDARLFAVLIRVAGRAGRLDVAMEMHDAMQEAGIAATRVGPWC